MLAWYFGISWIIATIVDWSWWINRNRKRYGEDSEEYMFTVCCGWFLSVLTWPVNLIVRLSRLWGKYV